MLGRVLVGFWSLLASAFLVSVFGFLLPLTSLHSDDRDVWLAVASLLWVGRFAIAFPAASRGRESSREVLYGAQRHPGTD